MNEADFKRMLADAVDVIHERTRAEVRASAEELRGEIRSSAEELRGEIRSSAEELRGEIRSSADELRGEMQVMRTELTAKIADVRSELLQHDYYLEGQIALVGEGVVMINEKLDRVVAELRSEMR